MTGVQTCALPISELITGVDLVKEMIWVAEGRALSFAQADLAIHGHALEVRVCAEDPTNNFLPDVGTLTTYVRPQGSGVRVDDGMTQGMDISIYYDPMIAKLVTYGKDRTEAIEKMRRAIDEYQITGVQTTLPFCRFVMDHEAFLSGQFDTRFVGLYFKPEMLQRTPSDQELNIVAALVHQLVEGQSAAARQASPESFPQKTTQWRSNRKTVR